MKNNPLVSILIPTYNRAALIHETLDSIIAQTYTTWECIVVDDGSTDNTKEILKEYARKDNRIQFYSRPSNRLKGANACRNYAYEMSKGSYIQWFDSDDLMHPEKLEIKINEIKNTIFDFVVCEGIEYLGNVSNVIMKWNKIFSENVLEDHITGKVNFHTNGPLFKRQFLENKKLFNETLLRKQEWEFYSRLLTLSTNYKPIYKALYYFRSHPNSINGNDSISTLKSRIKSNQLVFSLVMENLKKDKIENLRKHFFYKYLTYYKLARKSKDKNLIFVSMTALLSHLTFKMFLKGIFNTITKPHIVTNFLK
ncbi:glycosyltransferase family 2 protein [Bacteroidota bacterium]